MREICQLYYVVDKRDIKFEKGAKILVSFGWLGHVM
jgi:hypothetical protein